MLAEQNPLIRIDIISFLLCVFAMFLFPIKWVLGWIFAALVHELGHIVLLKFFGVRVYSLQIGLTGARILTEPMQCLEELLCALAGPIGGLTLVCCARKLPYAAFAAFIQSGYNLLPVYPLDGGRALRSFLCFFFSKKYVIAVTNIISCVTIIVLLIVGAWVSYTYRMGLFPILFPAMPILFAVWKNFLQSNEKNSTILKRIILRGNQG